MEKLDKVFEKFNGSYFGIIAFFISMVSITMALSLYLEVDSSFGITTNFVSDLGTGPNGSNIVFNIGMIFTGTFLIFFYLYLGKFLKKLDDSNSINVGMIAGLIGSIGEILIALFPLDSNNVFLYNMHILGAGLLFYGILIMLLIYGTSEYRSSEIPNLLAIISYISAILFGVFITLVIVQYLTSISFHMCTYIIEWIGLWIMGIWIIVHVHFTLKNK